MFNQTSTSMDTQFFSGMLGLCAELKDLNTGKEIHQAIKNCPRKEDDNMVLSSSLVNMYAKCGSLKDAQVVSYIHHFYLSFIPLFYLSPSFYLCFHCLLVSILCFDIQVFASTHHRDVISWTAMISAYLIY